jgi:ketosteroid isomerase-like protein
MLLNQEAVYRAFVAAYQVRDFARAASFTADDIVMALHIDRELFPFGGVTIGKAQVRQRWAMIERLFDMPLYRLEHVAETGDELHASVSYRFRHVACGEEIEGRMRHVAWMRDGLIARGSEYHDRARVEAFFRLIASST